MFPLIKIKMSKRTIWHFFARLTFKLPYGSLHALMQYVFMALGHESLHLNIGRTSSFCHVPRSLPACLLGDRLWAEPAVSQLLSITYHRMEGKRQTIVLRIYRCHCDH